MKNLDLQWWDAVAIPTINFFRVLGTLFLLVGGILFLILLLKGEEKMGILLFAPFGVIGVYYYILLPLLLEEGFYKESRICRLFVDTYFVFLFQRKKGIEIN